MRMTTGIARATIGSISAWAVLTAAGCATGGASPSAPPVQTWTTTWTAGQTVPAPASPTLSNQTLRVIAHVTLGGDRIRVKIANTFGSQALTLNAASIGLQQSGATLVEGTLRRLTFSGRSSASIPSGAYLLSDPVALVVAARSDLAISLFTAGETGPVTVHPLALQTSYASTAGDFSFREDAAAFVTALQSTPYLMGIEVRSANATRAIVAFGDSITDGYRSTSEANHRWPDYLADRLLPAHPNLAVVNEGISGNRIWHDAIPERIIFGPSGLSRFDRDAVTVAGTSHIVVMLGINDIGQAAPTRSPEEQVSADDVIAGLKQFALRAHAHGIKIFGATLTPFRAAAYFDTAGEAKRQLVNHWLRNNKDFDGCLDFDAALRDPAAPEQLLPAYDSGDHLHPNDAGYQAMAASIDLKLFE